MPLGEWHCGGDLHAAISGQLARTGVAEDSVRQIALLSAVHRHPQGGIRNTANWVCRAHGSSIIPVQTRGMLAPNRRLLMKPDVINSLRRLFAFSQVSGRDRDFATTIPFGHCQPRRIH